MAMVLNTVQKMLAKENMKIQQLLLLALLSAGLINAGTGCPGVRCDYYGGGYFKNSTWMPYVKGATPYDPYICPGVDPKFEVLVAEEEQETANPKIIYVIEEDQEEEEE